MYCQWVFDNKSEKVNNFVHSTHLCTFLHLILSKSKPRQLLRWSVIDLGHILNLESGVWFSPHATDIILDLDIIFPWQCTIPALHILSCCLLNVGPSVSVQCINCSGGCHKYFCLVKYICLFPAPPHFTPTLQLGKLTICLVPKVDQQQTFLLFLSMLIGNNVQFYLPMRY